MSEHACFLVIPSERYEESFLKGAAEFESEGRLDSTYAEFLGYDLERLRLHFAAFVMDLKRLAEKSRVRECGYQDKVFWLVDGDEYIGQTSIRPELGSSYLVTYGGHIGYSIRPSKRRSGYGKKILALALEKVAAMGPSRILVTCDSDNDASKKIIEHNGGQFESAMAMSADVLEVEGRKPRESVDKLRYWIELPEATRGRVL